MIIPLVSFQSPRLRNLSGILNKKGMQPLDCRGRNWAWIFQEICIYTGILKTRKLCKMEISPFMFHDAKICFIKK